MSVPDVLRLLAATAKTGRLRLESDTARGLVWLRGGRVSAVTSTDPDREMSAVEFLFWVTVPGTGRFRFEVGDVPDSADPVEVETVLAEVAALTAEWNELHRVVPSLGHRVGLVEHLRGPAVTIDATIWPAVRAAASEPEVRDLGNQFGLGDLDTLRAVRDLVSTGVVEVRPPLEHDTGRHRDRTGPVGAHH